MFRRTSLLFVAVSVAILVLAKVFIYADCYSFDSHDEANHAFPSLQVAREAILAGELPTINFYNNFGTPLLGDALTYPFAVQSISYYFFDSPVAMTLNRFIVAMATVISAFGFFRIYLSFFSAIVCALLIFFNPVSFWYPVHQYQMAAFFFYTTFFVLNKFNIHKSPRYFLALSLLLSVLILSVSINHLILMVPFVLIWSLCRNNFKFDRITLAPSVALIAGLLFSFLQTLEFFSNYAASTRVGEGVYDSILISMRELFLGLIIPPGEWIAYNYGAQLQITTYLSVPVMLAVLSGAWLIHKKTHWKQASLFFCGILPTAIAIILYMNSNIRLQIPLLKSVDITRVFWFSLPFCYVYVGYFISYARVGRFPITLSVLLLAITSVIFLSIWNLPETSGISLMHSIILLLFMGGTALLSLSCLSRKKQGGITKIGGALLVISLVLVPVPVIVRVLGLNTGYCGGTQYSANITEARFSPFPLIALMEKGNRLGTEIHTHKGHDLRVAAYGVLGSDARGIVINKIFGKYLEDRKLITVDQVPYGYFFSRPWQTDELTRLGIRYLLVQKTTDIELEAVGWTRLGGSNGLSLYENPNKPSPIYLDADGVSNTHFLRDYQFSATQIKVALPALHATSNLIVTILDRPGIEAEIDGVKAKILRQENGFIGLSVKPGDKIITVKHNPYSWVDVIVCVLGSILVCVSYGVFLKYRRP